ncbi:MAG: 1-acyl-sn-glycerol-3-phosphate acyltransferase [Verrucomicrobiae bacterium]|nr:1-acyl-sn-glycerol-3-phosphate acyltransferase [Verrucomicrobiae bacterium]
MEDHTCSLVTDVEALVPNSWRKRLHRVLVGVYFQVIALRHGERLPDSGAVFLGGHWIGALDGLVYNSVLPASVYMMSRQLTCNPVGRVFFCGIEVIREKDRATFPDSRKDNREAMKQCHKVLESGTNLFVFPEGTSSSAHGVYRCRVVLPI